MRWGGTNCDEMTTMIEVEDGEASTARQFEDGGGDLVMVRWRDGGDGEEGRDDRQQRFIWMSGKGMEESEQLGFAILRNFHREFFWDLL